MDSDFLEELSRPGAKIVSDGAFGPVLAEMGIDAPGENREMLNLRNPAAVKEIHRRYLDAGARIILTNTFRASEYRLKKTGMGSEVGSVNRAGVLIAGEAVAASGVEAWVFARMGPLWFRRKKRVPLDETERRTIYLQQAKALASESPDGFLVETMMDLTETRLAILSIREVSDKPVAASIRYRSGASGAVVSPSGNPLHQCIHGLQHAGADIIGFNGTYPADVIVRTVHEMTRLHSSPLWVRIPLATSSQAGLPKRLNTVDEALGAAGSLLKMGVGILGGDAGSTPAMVGSLAELCMSGG